MPKLERTILTIRGLRALEEHFQCEFIRTELDTSGKEPVGVFEKVTAKGETYGTIHQTERLLGDFLVSATTVPVEEDKDGGCEIHETEPLEAGKDSVSEDGDSADEEATLGVERDEATEGCPGEAPAGDDLDSSETPVTQGENEDGKIQLSQKRKPKNR